MKHKMSANRVLQVSGWVMESAALLLLLGAGGLMLLARHAREQDNVVTGLLALHLGFWSYVLGIVGVVLLPVLLLIARVRMRVNGVSRYSPVERRRRRFENPKQEVAQSTQQRVGHLPASPPPGTDDDQHASVSFNRVA